MNLIRANLEQVELIAPLFDAYRKFYRQSSDVASCAHYLRARLSSNESAVFVALENDGALGFAQMYPSFSSVSLKPLWILYDLFVAPDARRRGVGEQLLRKCQEHAAQTGAESLILETAVDNVAAQRLYEKLGWKRDTQFHRYAFALPQ